MSLAYLGKKCKIYKQTHCQMGFSKTWTETQRNEKKMLCPSKYLTNSDEEKNPNLNFSAKSPSCFCNSKQVWLKSWFIFINPVPFHKKCYFNNIQILIISCLKPNFVKRQCLFLHCTFTQHTWKHFWVSFGKSVPFQNQCCYPGTRMGEFEKKKHKSR